MCMMTTKPAFEVRRLFRGFVHHYTEIAYVHSSQGIGEEPVHELVKKRAKSQSQPA